MEVASATSAAPGNFPPIKIMPPSKRQKQQKRIRFKDGGFGSNYRSEEAYHDIIATHGGLSKNIGPFISIGTGESRSKLFSKKGNFRDFLTNFKAATQRPTLTTLIHQSMLQHANHDNEVAFHYFRFEDGRDLGAVVMDEWKTYKCTFWTQELPGSGIKALRKIRLAVVEYLEQPEVERQLDDCARILVERRRLRTRSISQWERYASTLYFLCDDEDCKEAEPLPLTKPPPL